jgi:Arylsulfotransferase (ASST)/Secretion system C-terminal sorting domain
VKTDIQDLRRYLFILSLILLFSVVKLQASSFNSEINQLTGKSLSNSPKTIPIIYVSPLPGSKLVSPQSSMIIKSAEKLNAATISDNLFKVVGSESGIHRGKIILADDQRTLIFKPDNNFYAGETVSFTLNYGIKTFDDKNLEAISFEFNISEGKITQSEKRAIFNELLKKEYGSNTGFSSDNYPQNFNNVQPKNKLAKGLDLPNDFPVLEVTQSQNPSKGYIFLTNVSLEVNGPYKDYIIIADNEGNPVFYRKMTSPCYDFKIQPNGTLTYYDSKTLQFYALNSSFAIVDSFSCGNGYQTDLHELLELPDGHVFLIGDDYEKVDMSKIVEGGNPDATVIGIIIQELDQDRNVVFQWRSWDHFNITDAINQNLTDTLVDYVHTNAIEIDNDGNILISSRHLSEITKINSQTGDIIWRLGGKNNQFTFVNDDIGFSYQHAIRRLPNGDVILFDDGNYHTPPFSRGVEYKLDEQNKIATLVWQYRNNPDIYGFAMGYVQRLDNGNSLICWGAANTTVTEVTMNGDIALEMKLPQNQWSYRAYRLPLIILESPKGNERWLAGSHQRIIWNSSGVDSVNIDFSIDNGTTWDRIISGYPADSSSYKWEIPSVISNNCLVKVSDASNPQTPDVTVSDSVFSIDTSFSVNIAQFQMILDGNNVNFKWTVSKESNNEGFTIRRKFGSTGWRSLVFLPSSSDSNYEYTDVLDTSYSGTIYYRLENVDSSGESFILKEMNLKVHITPVNYKLYNNYPNPFNPSTVIKYSLPFDSKVTIKIYDALGRLVKTLVDGIRTTGDHKIVFNGNRFSSGVYFYSMVANAVNGGQKAWITKKMLLLK